MSFQFTDLAHFNNWSKKLANKSNENCYNIQEARVIDRSKGRFISPVRLKNKNILSNRSPSPSAHSLASIKTTISTSTPTHSTLGRLHRNNNNNRSNIRGEVASVFDCDKEVRNEGDDDNLKYNSISVIENTCHAKNSASYSYRNELSRTIGGYSVPYREKRNPLNNTRLSCYKPPLTFTSTSIDHRQNKLKIYKSVEDFLSMDNNNDSNNNIESPTEFNNKIRDDLIGDTQAKTMNEFDSTQQKVKHRRGLSSKFRSMSDKTQKLLSKFYSSTSNLKSSSEVCNDFTIIQPKKLTSAPSEPSSSNVSHSRRSLSYGMLPDLKDYEVMKKIETEDCDSGILVNESGASSMIETENEEKLLIKNNGNVSSTANSDEDTKKSDEKKIDRKFVQR